MSISQSLAAAIVLLFTLQPHSSEAFTARPCSRQGHHYVTSRLLAAPSNPPTSEDRRRELLSRKGPHFQLDRSTGRIEFGATANLLTSLVKDPQPSMIRDWLGDTVGLAQSIWDPDLISQIDTERSIFRLQIMTLQFVTIQLTPTVDVQMKTLTSKSSGDPIFSLQSINYDPNIQVFGMPGLSITAESLGITIEVSGQMKPSKDDKGVVGAIAFQTTGELPLPMRILPEVALKAASDAINQAVVNFAVESFQKGAKKNFDEFLWKQQEQLEQG
jgi:hypothetical protein